MKSQRCLPHHAVVVFGMRELVDVNAAAEQLADARILLFPLPFHNAPTGAMKRLRPVHDILLAHGNAAVRRTPPRMPSCSPRCCVRRRVSSSKACTAPGQYAGRILHHLTAGKSKVAYAIDVLRIHGHCAICVYCGRA